MMRCVYINLPSAQDRRARMESHFAAVAPAGVSLERLEAFDATSVQSIPGAATPTEKACFRSHREAIATHHDGEMPLLVLEDDVILSPGAFRAHGLAGGWDLMLLDAAIGDVRLWPRLEEERGRLAGRSRILDLSALIFASAAAYVVNSGSRGRVLEALDAFERLDVPYDIALRQLVHAGRLKACLTFPFLTSIAAFSDDTSQIRETNSLDALSNSFRRRIFYGSGDGQDATKLAQAAMSVARAMPS